MTEARKDRRAPASIKVKYKSANMTEFVELVGGDVSRGGIFVKTKKPLEPGALLKFEFQLQTGEPMIYGVGRVAWRRTEEGSRANLPAGMGIKFIKLNGLSRSVIDRIEAKHGPGSRFDQTDGAEIASSISSAPPSGLSQAPELAASVPPSATLITPLRPEAMRAAAEADARATHPSLDESGRPTRSSPALKEARVSGPRPSVLPATFRPPPPAAVDSVPPPHSSSSNPPRAPSDRPGSSGAFGPLAASATGSSGTYKQTAAGSGSHGVVKSSGAPAMAKSSGAYSQSGAPAEALGGGHAPRGALGSGGPGRRPISTRSAARDASEFLASAFSVGGAGREVRSEAHAQAERARHDPRSVDLANELFGDFNATGSKPDATLDADPMLGQFAPTTPPPADPGATARLSPGPLPARLPDAEPGPRLSPGPARVGSPTSASPRLRTPGPAPANNQLSLKLGAAGNETTLRPAAGGRAVWIAGIAVLGLAIGAAAFYLQRGTPASVVGSGTEPQPIAAPQPTQPAAAAVEAAPEVVTVELPLSSEPAGAEVIVDGAASGSTPVTLKLTAGKTVQISLSAPGYATKVESVNVVADLPARSVKLEPLPYELVVTEPVGATVKVLDKSVEAPAPLNLGALYPPSGTGSGAGPQEITVTVEKAGFQRATRKLTRADFREQDTAMRAELSMPLVATGPAAKAAAPAKAVAPKTPPSAAAKAAAAPTSAPPEPGAPPPEPEPAAPAEPAAAAPAAPAAVEKPKAEPAPAPVEAPPAEPAPAPEKKPASDIPTDL